MISDFEQFQLRKMLEQSDFKDHTNTIREQKHCSDIRRCVLRILELKREHADLYKSDYEEFDRLVLSECGFLFHHYMELYNVLMKDQVDTTIMLELLNTLQLIEDGTLDQHEGSFVVGKRLKEIYVDSTLAKAVAKDQPHVFNPHKELTWADYKRTE